MAKSSSTIANLRQARGPVSLQVTLSQGDAQHLVELAARMRCKPQEVISRLIRREANEPVAALRTVEGEDARSVVEPLMVRVEALARDIGVRLEDADVRVGDDLKQLSDRIDGLAEVVLMLAGVRPEPSRRVQIGIDS